MGHLKSHRIIVFKSFEKPSYAKALEGFLIYSSLLACYNLVMDFKLIFGLLATILSIFAFLPYIRDIFKNKTKPHLYSWLVWSIIQSVGVLAMIKGGAEFGSWGLAIGCLFCILIFFLSFKYGTKNITKIDTILLLATLITIVIWLREEDPLWSVILITIIDLLGFIPTYRKTYLAPDTETLDIYVLDVFSYGAAIVAIASYSLATTLYVGSLVLTNLVMVIIVLRRRSQSLIQKKYEG
ncbi:MAG: hypothetical protein A2406_04315 [Candidatus Komeilibacteria bacterium RIFOXYC1_FULL_37_11]|uniref:Uncharacterized protein n=1 Tax=Candidatus Komeilibacteria bacterium RIFOXYC1_FULL_37_11 TaxID=1798555 RepID=A0A1G2C008_9BACT|nr:MAG: hypothetical protein A2406_04315 [Candidatus Komeilibacteria bacterium RIFOXYC1_FULL_37_11]OGY95432.1 MAG: hypothetical protein A2611_01900 [Candidatus Komeilibacteria bacterium RIFOXYD1_FULL_37_29]